MRVSQSHIVEDGKPMPRSRRVTLHFQPDDPEMSRLVDLVTAHIPVEDQASLRSIEFTVLFEQSRRGYQPRSGKVVALWG